MNEDLRKIKKKYGENMMHLCRELFPTLLEKPNLLFDLLSSRFDHTRDLYDSIVSNGIVDTFKDFIFSLVDIQESKIETDKNPFDLLREAGYTLYECKTQEDINKFKKYYWPGEELCTFSTRRLDSWYVFFAVKDNAEELYRPRFTSPNRQDSYGTSVISIQFFKGKTNTVSIKNRYNDIVKNADATFSNNLDNIIPGLTDAFEKAYGYKVMKIDDVSLEIPGYVKDNSGKYYKYYMSVNGIYYCENNVIIANDKHRVDDYKDSERYVFADCYIIDLKEKRVISYDNNLQDGFLYTLSKADKIEIEKKSNSKVLTFKTKGKEDIILEIDNTNQIIGYKNNNTSFIGSKFMYSNEKLEYLEMNNVEMVGNNFLYSNKCLKSLSMNRLAKTDNFFLRNNSSIEVLFLPSLVYTKNGFLEHNKSLKRIYIPNIESVGGQFLAENEIIDSVYFPKLKYAGEMFMYSNNSIEIMDLPSLEEIKIFFMDSSRVLKELYLANCKKLNPNMVSKSECLEYIDIPLITEYPFSDFDKPSLRLEELLREKLDTGYVPMLSIY